MNNIEKELKNLILSRYRSILEFSKEVQMPYSTIDNIFKRGVVNANVANIIRICTALNISADELARGRITPLPEKEESVISCNRIVAIAKGGDKVEYELSDEEMQAFLTLLNRKNDI